MQSFAHPKHLQTRARQDYLQGLHCGSHGSRHHWWVCCRSRLPWGS
ncbi:MAG: hypothetical protein FJY29_03170 [Betaproteobacteria bacterium]|nr:hypothetical protein [Betaproteobacteria bacterium]